MVNSPIRSSLVVLTPAFHILNTDLCSMFHILVNSRHNLQGVRMFSSSVFFLFQLRLTFALEEVKIAHIWFNVCN